MILCPIQYFFQGRQSFDQSTREHTLLGSLISHTESIYNIASLGILSAQFMTQFPLRLFISTNLKKESVYIYQNEDLILDMKTWPQNQFPRRTGMSCHWLYFFSIYIQERQENNGLFSTFFMIFNKLNSQNKIQSRFSLYQILFYNSE